MNSYLSRFVVIRVTERAPIDGELRLYYPELTHPKRNALRYSCRWSLTKLVPDPLRVAGEDELHATLNCLAMIEHFLTLSEDDDIFVDWKQPGDRAGFLDV